MQENILRYEDDVLSIVQDYLNQNRFFILEDIIPFIQVRIKTTTNLNQTGIRKILNSLIKKRMIVERSKFTKEDVLDNENRSIIYTYIKDHPGAYFNQISKKLNLSNYILAWHLKILSQFEYIRSKEIENHEAFFDVDLEHANDEILFLISKEKPREIINYLLKNPTGSSKTQISRELSMHANTVTKYVKQLERGGLLLKNKQSQKTLYIITKQFYSSLFV